LLAPMRSNRIADIVSDEEQVLIDSSLVEQ
jgi:hypothetical protein